MDVALLLFLILLNSLFAMSEMALTASRKARLMIHSTCPFTLRNSSAAHFSSAS
jgi:CBS domain containing-hemolysin-like protein